ncbi:MAG: RagB/SusD family nutrient uptake outer membrane protein [Bacteroidota bacterium]
MKKIIIIVSLIILLANISCDDELELEPVNSTTAEDFYTNANNLRSGLYGIYSALQNRGIASFSRLEGMSDNCISDGTFIPDIAAYATGESFVSGQFRSVELFYSDNYVLIQRANLLLDNIDGIPAISDEEREGIRAEARALRSYSYMNLVYLFGDVPLLSTFTERDAILSVSRTPRNEVIQFVLDEFEATAGVLANTPATDGRLSKQAVLGLRARAMLYEARLGNQSWVNALSAVNTALTEANNGGSMLIDTDSPDLDYQSLFNETNEGNAEFIFSIRNNSTDLGENYLNNYSWQAGALFTYVHQNLADAYSYADGTEYSPTDDTYIDRDPRLSANVMHEGLSFGGATYDGTDNGGFVGANSIGTATNLFQHKFVTTDFSTTWNEGTLDLPVLRYADLLLMQAEALNETGGDSYPQLNAVRDRAGLPALSGLSQDELRDAIILERRLEFAFEGLRWFDLITLGIAENSINGIQEERADIIRGFTTGRNELLPFPQSEIELNANLSPNPGYN